MYRCYTVFYALQLSLSYISNIAENSNYILYANEKESFLIFTHDRQASLFDQTNMLCCSEQEQLFVSYELCLHK